MPYTLPLSDSASTSSTSLPFYRWWCAPPITETRHSLTKDFTTLTVTQSCPSSTPNEPQTTTLSNTITVTAEIDNPSRYTDYILLLYLTPSTPSSTLSAPATIPSPPPSVSDTVSSAPPSDSILPSPSLRSPSLFPPNGLANATSCQCTASALAGLYCGFCSQIKVCEKGSSCWTNAYSCGGTCVDFGFLAHCAQAARAGEGKGNCPFYSQ